MGYAVVTEEIIVKAGSLPLHWSAQWAKLYPLITGFVFSTTSLHPCVCISHSYVHVRRRQWHPTPVILPGKSHGQRSLVGYSPWGREESDTTGRLHFHFSLSSTGEGNGNPFQYSCLENSMERGAWWATVIRVTVRHNQSNLACTHVVLVSGV